ncbi:hypothetical protein E4A48_12455 [Xanthomonas cerealis pv. cerealis]|uniref:Uncharacterized protein n=1 Tax=Xanthomonas cerealis pv. cerealis TaxID=152263 RepID=A0A514EIN4_9XANT|nr:hypothetical protein E4A48_12455 [Xanthomonas translucens pv. cerealis]UKE49077.1 hypothetical protein KHA79_15035 [Xanthomonas translucens pv. cerealis]
MARGEADGCTRRPARTVPKDRRLACAATGFAAMSWDCATGDYSCAHEIGHLQSARHVMATDSGTSPYA